MESICISFWVMVGLVGGGCCGLLFGIDETELGNEGKFRVIWIHPVIFNRVDPRVERME